MRKFRCLVADGEGPVAHADRLERLFLSFGGKFELVGIAYSSEEAIEIAVEKQPDIILIDIVMPDMNGIEWIEGLKPRLSASAVFMILTAYEDFEYAKQAIKQNVLDYIMKSSSDASVIRAALERAADEIIAREEQEERLSKLQRASLENIYRLRKQVLGELFRGEASAVTIGELSENLRVQRELHAYNAIVIELCEYDSFIRKTSTKDQRMLKYEVLGIIEKTIDNYAKGFACEISENQMLAVVSWPMMSSARKNEQQAMELGQALLVQIGKYMNQNMNIAYSGVANGWGELAEAYHRAYAKVKDLFYMEEDGKVFGPSYHTAPLKGHEEAIEKEFWGVMNCLKLNVATKELTYSFERLARRVKEGRVDREQIERRLLEIVSAARDVVGKFTGESGGICLFESKDGVSWENSPNPKVLGSRFLWEDGSRSESPLDRPQILLKDGKPHVLYGAICRHTPAGEMLSLSVFIPLHVPDQVMKIGNGLI